MNQSFDTLKIDTPENVTFSYDVAGIGSRFLAALLDTFLIGLLQVIVIGTGILITLELVRSASGSSASDTSGQTFWWVLGVLTLISFIFFWGYYIFFEIFWNGQTPGKRWIGLRVIRLDGTPVTASEVVIRNLVRTLDLLPTAYGVGVVAMFISTNSRRLGDLAAGTLVVRDSRTSLQDASGPGLDPLRAVHVPAALPADFPLEKISDADMQVLESFLLRRRQLANRRQLALYLLQSICARLGRSLDPSFEQDPESALEAIHQARQALASRGSEAK